MVKVPKSRIFFSLISCLLITTPAYSNPKVGVWNIVSTFVGSPYSRGYQEGTGSAARFENPYAITIDSSGTLYVADNGNYRIRKITSSGTTSLLAGSGTTGYAEGTGASAQFNTFQWGIAADNSGNVYVSDTTNNRVRKITSGGTTSLLAGSTSGYQEGTGAGARLSSPRGLAVNSAGTVYVATATSERIRAITSGGTTSLLAGSGATGYVEGTGSAAQFSTPTSVAVDSSGTVYVIDANNYRIRKITSGGTTSLFAGSTQGYAEGTGSAARFNFFNLIPSGITVDNAGTVYVADTFNYRIRTITPGGVTSTLAGTTQGFVVDVPGAVAKFDRPVGIAVDNSSGAVYIANYDGSCIVKMDPLQIYINTDAAPTYVNRDLSLNLS
ncbi:hypothetical protein [Candidatus Odyssella thessalonicensis]|uniref:hypothetical protein n=1 Tax=Candidatus Odyssella thessalonicensis TaxID=84647 RepID=UPI000225BEC5|nr:hypothetical protein [Candidatus Odyssella thessalonicensis]